MRTRMHLCPFLETDGTPLKNRFELFSLLKPMIFLFFGSTLLLLAWITPDCGESDAPFPLTNFVQPHRCHLMVNAPVIDPAPNCFASFNRVQFSTNFLPKANSFPLLSISMNMPSCVTCTFFVLFLAFCQWLWVLNGNFYYLEDYIHYIH